MKRGLDHIWRCLRRTFLPADMAARGPDAVRRAELTLAIVALGLPIALARIVMLLASGVIVEALVRGGLLLLLLGVLLIFRRTGSLTLIGNTVALVFFGGMSFALYERGGVSSPPAVALGLTPLFASFIAGWRAGLFWAVAAVAEVALCALLAPDLPDLLPAASRIPHDLIGVAVFTALALAASAAYDLARRAAVEAQGRAERERARAREEARMLRTNRMAAVGQLAAGVAHEINTPLTYVMANLAFVEAQLARLRAGGAADLDDERARLAEAVAEARDGTARVASIVRDLNSFVRVDEEETEPLDVRAVMDVAIKMAEIEIRHRARLSRDHGAVWPVRASETRLTQVFLNLLVNAAQAIPAGHADEHEIAVTIGLAGASDGGGGEGDGEQAVCIEVRDTGAGIPADILPRVTEPFFTTKAVGVGTGLGLAVCKNIVEGYGGALAIHSEVGRGTRVRITLPAARGVALEPARVARRAVTDDNAPPCRVLLVDDDAILTRALCRALRAHQVDVATSGHEALERLRADPDYDAIVCDLMMPEMTGIELYRQLGALGLDVRERIVFLTGGAFTGRARAFLEGVPNRTLHKPVMPERLEAVILETAGGRCPGRAEQAAQ